MTLRSVGEWKTVTQACDALGLSRQAIGDWLKKPGAEKYVRNRKGRRELHWPGFPTWRDQQLQGESREKPAADPRKLQTADAELRRALADAEMAELKVTQLRGEMVSDADATAEITRFCERVRATILSIPSRYQTEILDLRTIPEAGQALRRIAAGILTDLERDAGGTSDTADLKPAASSTAA